MFKSNIKIAFRSLFRHKTYSLINIFGLGLGLATGFIMLLWVNNEYSTDKFHSKADRIYQVNAKMNDGKEETIWEQTPGPVSVYAKDNISDIELTTRVKVDRGRKQAVKSANKIFVEDNIGYTDNDFFHIFDFPILAGDRVTPLPRGLSVVLTESTAKKYFGDQNPIGNIISFRDTTFQVTGVMKDFPSNSSLQFSLLFSMDIVRIKFHGNGDWKTIDDDWGNYNYSTFCLFKKGAGTKTAAASLLDVLHKSNPGSAVVSQFVFRPLGNMYLYKPNGSKGRMIMVEIFFIVAIFVLLIAAINYINLVTARATQRVKEISVRKIIGADKNQLFWQFFIETGVLLLMATLASFIFAQLLLPVYKEVSATNINFNLADWRLWKLLLIILGSIWLLTGLYPALLLSSFKPLQSLKGKGFLSNGGTLRKTLVVLQFVVSITLLLGTVFIHRQMNFIQTKDLNVN
ncbi:MAG: ABC transporter permease, partial [Chitinophagaceae bacterium]